MPETDNPENEDRLAACESGFERDLMTRLLERGYRVQSQVGSLGYRIDMVVEGQTGARLAVECDGDRYHGPEQWRQDMRRQRTLERVGWHFWRCFASSFYRDPDAIVAELVDRLSRMRIEPAPRDGAPSEKKLYTEARVVDGTPVPVTLSAGNGEMSGVKVGDKIVVRYSDDQRRISVRLTEAASDLEKGRLSVTSPLGAAILGAEEGDEITIQSDDGRERTAMIETVERTSEKHQSAVH
jgi:transcription elongation GreA/GreB family factor